MKIILIGILCATLLLTVGALARFVSKLKEEPVPTPTPTPPPFDLQRLSSYANDPDIIKSETEINKIDKYLQEINFNESELLPPKLDMNIKF